MPTCRAHLLLEIKMVRQITNNPFLTIQKDIDECRYFEDMYSSATSTTRNYVYTKNLAVGTLPCADNAYCLVSNVDLRQVTFFFCKKSLKPKTAPIRLGLIFVDAIPVMSLVMMKMLLIIFLQKIPPTLITLGKRLMTAWSGFQISFFS